MDQSPLYTPAFDWRIHAYLRGIELFKASAQAAEHTQDVLGICGGAHWHAGLGRR